MSGKSEILELGLPNEYASAKAGLVSLTQPQHIASFSFGEERELLLDDASKDSSLKWYGRQPALGIDLRYGFERCIWRSDELDEGLDALLDWWAYCIN